MILLVPQGRGTPTRILCHTYVAYVAKGASQDLAPKLFAVVSYQLRQDGEEAGSIMKSVMCNRKRNASESHCQDLSTQLIDGLENEPSGSQS